MPCKRCEVQLAEWKRLFPEGDFPRCGFDENGKFTPNNWNCATLTALRDYASDDSREPWEAWHNRDDMNNGSIWVIPMVDNDDYYGGYIVLTGYKDRGKTGNAVVVFDDEPPRELTLQYAEDVIEELGIKAWYEK